MAFDTLDGGRIEQRELAEEMRSSYLDYAMSVIVGRALPDVRDGLKPVHRRVLFAMNESGLQPGRPYSKCARVVGDVLGKYHPHGDTAAYDTLTGLQPQLGANQTILDDDYAAYLDAIPAGTAKTDGVAVGPQAAHAVQAWRGGSAVDLLYLEPEVVKSPPPPNSTG